MAVLRIQENVKKADGTYDVVHKETEASLVLFDDNETFQQKYDSGELSCPGNNPNLLDNWYFADPVNQRGGTSWTGWSSSIDRWFSGNTVQLTAGGIQLGEQSHINQKMEPSVMRFLAGKKVTFSVLSNEKGLTSGTAILTYPSEGDQVFAMSEGGVVQLFCVGDVFKIWGNNVTLVAAKLELGDTQTLAHQDDSGNWVLNEIPNHADQYAICAQYDITTGEFLGAIPPTRTINGHALTDDIVLGAGDVGAAASNHNHDTRYIGTSGYVYGAANGSVDPNNLKAEYHGFIFNCTNTPTSYGFIDVFCADTSGFAPSWNGVVLQVWHDWNSPEYTYTRLFRKDAWTAWSLGLPASHTHSYLPLSGGTLNGDLNMELVYDSDNDYETSKRIDFGGGYIYGDTDSDGYLYIRTTDTTNGVMYLTAGAFYVAGGLMRCTKQPADASQCFRNIYAGTGAMTASSTTLANGTIYMQYE